MKSKLTLSVEKHVIDKAKRYSKKTGKSISELFEEVFSNDTPQRPKTDLEIAAREFLELVAKRKTSKDLGDDKTLIKEHVRRKYS